jgi:hypothetical protein
MSVRPGAAASGRWNLELLTRLDLVGIRDVGKGSSMAPIWGNSDMEAHATFSEICARIRRRNAHSPQTMSGLS